MIFGAAQVTLLRDEAYNFLQLGAFLERGDNTARILDVKYHRLMPDGSPHAETLDYFAWSEVLACIGAVRTYRRIYRSSLDPMKSRRADDAAPRRAALGASLPLDGRSQHARAGRRLRHARRGRPAGRRAACQAALCPHRPGLRYRPAQVPGRRARRYRDAQQTKSAASSCWIDQCASQSTTSRASSSTSRRAIRSTTCGSRPSPRAASAWCRGASTARASARNGSTATATRSPPSRWRSPHDAVEIEVAGLYEYSGADQWLRYGETPTLPAPFWLRNIGMARARRELRSGDRGPGRTRRRADRSG